MFKYIKVKLGQCLVNALMLLKTKEDRGMGGGGLLTPTHLYNLVGGKGLSGHMVLVEHHIDTCCGYEYGQVHFNGFAHCHFVAAVSIHFRIIGLWHKQFPSSCCCCCCFCFLVCLCCCACCCCCFLRVGRVNVLWCFDFIRIDLKFPSWNLFLFSYSSLFPLSLTLRSIF